MIILFIAMLLLFIILIGYLVWFLFRKDDEITEQVKRKSMIDSFLTVVAYLLLQTFVSIYNVFIKDLEPEKINPFMFLAVLGILFFIFFGINKKKISQKK